MIEEKGLTLKYPNGKGIENVDISVKQGEVMGYLRPNVQVKLRLSVVS